MSNQKYNVQVLVDGKQVKEYNKYGNIYIESKFGTEYSIKLKNNTYKRVLAIVSIDGINTISGEIAKPDSTGYVINAYNSVEIKGYRENNDGGGRFRFTEKNSGYAKTIDGTGINSGVIGVMFTAEADASVVIQQIIQQSVDDYKNFPQHPWSEPVKPWAPSPPYTETWFSNSTGTGGSDYLYKSSCNFCQTDDSLQSKSVLSYSNAVEAPKFDAATTWGSKFEEKLTTVEFNKSNEMETHNIYYASYDSLKGMGIIKENQPQIALPQSFPGFAKPPFYWNWQNSKK